MFTHINLQLRSAARRRVMACATAGALTLTLAACAPSNETDAGQQDEPVAESPSPTSTPIEESTEEPTSEPTESDATDSPSPDASGTSDAPAASLPTPDPAMDREAADIVESLDTPHGKLELRDLDSLGFDSEAETKKRAEVEVTPEECRPLVNPEYPDPAEGLSKGMSDDAQIEVTVALHKDPSAVKKIIEERREAIGECSKYTFTDSSGTENERMLKPMKIDVGEDSYAFQRIFDGGVEENYYYAAIQGDRVVYVIYKDRPDDEGVAKKVLEEALTAN